VKKSVILLELIISILLLSFIGIYSMQFLSNLYQKNSQNLKILNSNLDLQTTNLFITNKLKYSENIKVVQENISFYEIDINNFKSGYYSGFVMLEKSTKEFVYTPNSFMSNIDVNYIWFADDLIYEVENSNENNKIYFKNKTSKKKIYEQYKLLTKQSNFFVKNSTLYFNENILLDNISSFSVKQNSANIIIDICSNICQNWVINYD
jgi:hypothetical protein